jgi:hypothetical protein
LSANTAKIKAANQTNGSGPNHPNADGECDDVIHTPPKTKPSIDAAAVLKISARLNLQVTALSSSAIPVRSLALLQPLSTRTLST